MKYYLVSDESLRYLSTVAYSAGCSGKDEEEIMMIKIEDECRKIEIPNTWPPILKFFTYEHLPAHLQVISKPFSELAQTLVRGDYEHSEQISHALIKLLEAKDCAVRAFLKA